MKVSAILVAPATLMNPFRFLAILFLALTSVSALAHQVETVEFEFLQTDTEWRLEGQMDIAYMLPEIRKIPGGLPLSREATEKAPPEELARIRRETEKTLRGILRITWAGKDVPFRFAFPDFDKTPFSLPEEAADWALLTTRIIVDKQPGPGELTLHWSGEEESELIILTDDSEEGEIFSVLPGDKLTLIKLATPKPAPSPDQPVTEPATTAKAPPAPNQSAFLGWIKSGYLHVVPVGFDHILFILGMFLMIPKWKPLLQQSLMFTLAHSLTLALSVLGWVAMPSKLLQVLIPLSIAFIGIENLLSSKLGRLRMFTVLGFGLVHGIGIASGLGDKLRDLPRAKLTEPLIGTNIGVELAQITILAVAFLFFLPLKKWEKTAFTTGSVVISLAGIVWMVERLLNA